MGEGGFDRGAVFGDAFGEVDEWADPASSGPADPVVERSGGPWTMSLYLLYGRKQESMTEEVMKKFIFNLGK